MKKKIRQILIQLIMPINKKLGLVKPEIKNEFSKDYLLHTLFTNLKKMDFKINHIVDVGANTGSWSTKTMEYFPDAYYTLIEPQERLGYLLSAITKANPKTVIHHVGAGAKPGKFKFTLVDRNDSCTFNITEEDAQLKGLTQIEVPIDTIDNILVKNSWPAPELIKIDAEGLDIEVLKGASNYLGKTEIFMVEVSVFKNSFVNNTFYNMINYMDTVGYKLFDITDLNRTSSPKVLWLAELVFIKKDGYIDNYRIN